jgi:hypothetical protein
MPGANGGCNQSRRRSQKKPWSIGRPRRQDFPNNENSAKKQETECLLSPILLI